MPTEELYLDQDEVRPEFHGPFEMDLSDDDKHPQWATNPHHQQEVFYASRRKKIAQAILTASQEDQEHDESPPTHRPDH